MPGTVLRVSGSKSGVQRFLEQSRWKPIIVYWKAKPRLANSPRLSTFNGFNHSVSDADGSSFDLQLRHAKRFLTREHLELKRLKELKLQATLDFGVEARRDVLANSYRFDAQFLSQVASAGIDLELSQYTVDMSDGDDALLEPSRL